MKYIAAALLFCFAMVLTTAPLWIGELAMRERAVKVCEEKQEKWYTQNILPMHCRNAICNLEIEEPK